MNNSSDDFSRLSGISNLSRISKVNNSTLYKFDSTSNFSEWRSICRDATSFTTDSQKIDSKRISESAKVNKALGVCEDSTCDHAKLQLIYDCLEEIANTENNVIEAETIKKFKELITVHNVKKYLYLPNHSKDLNEELTLLGIIDLPQHEFSYEEQLAIKSCLETKLREKIHSFITMYKNLAGSTTKEIVKSNDSMLRSRFQQKSELESLHLKDKIDEICLEHKKNLIHCLKMLKEYQELKSKMHEKNSKYAESLLLQSEIAEMKAVIAKLSCTLRMYKETPETVDAFKVLSNSLDERIANVTDEILEKTELIKAYEALSGTEYDEILKDYLVISHDIKKKKMILDNL